MLVALLCRVGECTLIGASGEYSDFQHIMGVLEDDNQYDVNMDDGFERSPSEIYNLLRTIMYNRRYVWYGFGAVRCEVVVGAIYVRRRGMFWYGIYKVRVCLAKGVGETVGTFWYGRKACLDGCDICLGTFDMVCYG